MKSLISIRDLDVKGKKVLCRFDFNVPVENGKIEDNRRIKETIPTLNYLLERDAKIIMMSHLGRPGGERNEEYTLRPVSEELEKLIEREVKFVGETTGERVRQEVEKLKKEGLLLLENTRFNSGEKENDPVFSGEIASLGEVYINDAFGTAHRKHASTFGVAKIMKKKAAGLLLEREIVNLGRLLKEPEHPFTMILGGAKLQTKIPVIKHLAPLMDNLLIGGAMAFIFLRRRGFDTGNSMVDESLFSEVDNLLPVLEEKGVNLMLPEDFVITEKIEEEPEWTVVSNESIPPEFKGVDIGPETIKKFGKVISESGTVFWNGPMGVYEVKPFDRGTLEIAKAMGQATERGALTVVGGGDTDRAFLELDVSLSHISTGGGAALRFLSGRELPAIEILSK